MKSYDNEAVEPPKKRKTSVPAGTLRMRSHLALLAIVGLSAMLEDRSRGQEVSQAGFLQYRDEEFRFSIHYPRSWAKVAASHPDTRFKAGSNGGAGPDDVSVVVTRLLGSQEVTPEEFVESLVNPQAYLAYVQQSFSDARFIEHGPTTLSNQPAYYFVMELTHRVLGMQVPMRQMQVQTARNHNMYTITFRSDPARYSEVFVLFQVIAAGFVLWPDPPDETIGRLVHSPGKDDPTVVLAGGLRTVLLMGLFALGAAMLRFVLIGRPLSKISALALVAPVWLALLWFHREAGRASAPAWLSGGAVVAFFLLISAQKSAKANSAHGDDSGASGKPSVGAH